MLFKSVLPFVAVASAAAVAHVDGRQTCNEASEAELMAAKEAFVNEMVDPDVIQNFEPNGTLDVSYPEGSVTLGNKFNLLQTIPAPDFSFSAIPGQDPEETKYTLIMVDPDAPEPTSPLLRYFLHYIVSDAQPDCVASQNRKVVAPYMFPTPLSIAPHRYTMLVYRQPPNFDPPTNAQNLPAVRNNFDLDAYIEQAGLIGPAVAGNFYKNGLQQLVDAIHALQELEAADLVEQVGFIVGNVTSPLEGTVEDVSEVVRGITAGLNRLTDGLLGGIL